jgi:hypothetical protein
VENQRYARAESDGEHLLNHDWRQIGLVDVLISIRLLFLKRVVPIELWPEQIAGHGYARILSLIELDVLSMEAFFQT